MADERLSRIENKLDHVVEKISNIDVTLASQHASLCEHIRRTVILEEKMEPVQKHVAQIQGALKFIGLIAIFGGIIEAGVELLTYIRGLK